MGDICDQIGFQPFAFHLFRQGHLQPPAGVVEIFRSLSDFSGKLRQIYLVGGFSICQMADSQINLVAISRSAEHDVKNPQIQTEPQSRQHPNHNFKRHRKNMPL